MKQLPSCRARSAVATVVLDGNAWIASVAEALALQGRFALQSEIEPMIVVAVGYPGDKPFDLGRRAYDFLSEHSSESLPARFMQGLPWHQPGRPLRPARPADQAAVISALCRAQPLAVVDDGQFMKQADAAIAGLPRDLAAGVLVAVGERETPDRPAISVRMEADARAFCVMMARQGPSGARVSYRVFEGENHQSLPAAALSAVLRFATADGRAP